MYVRNLNEAERREAYERGFRNIPDIMWGEMSNNFAGIGESTDWSLIMESYEDSPPRCIVLSEWTISGVFLFPGWEVEARFAGLPCEYSAAIF